MNKVTEQNACKCETYNGWCIEASDLRLEPGFWPMCLETTLGNQSPFRLMSVDEVGGHYRQDFGVLELVVFND